MLLVAGIVSGIASEAVIGAGLLEAVPAVVAAIFGGSYLTLRTVFKRMINRRHRLLSGLMEKLASYTGPTSQPPLLEAARAEEEKVTPTT